MKIFCRDCANHQKTDSDTHILCLKNPRYLHHTRLLKDLDRHCKYYTPTDEMKRVHTRPKPGERCLIFKISFSEQQNYYEFQELMPGDLDFIITDNQFQKFFNDVAPEIYEKLKLPIPEELQAGE